MWGRPIKPEYADVKDGFGSLMTPVVLNFAIKGASIADGARLAQNFRCADIRERD